MEQSVYALLRTRDMAIARYKDFGVPTHWMLDTGLVGKVFEVTSSEHLVWYFLLDNFRLGTEVGKINIW